MGVLLVVGEPIVAYQRDLTSDPQAPFEGPWPSGSPAICAYVAGRLGVPTVFAGAVGDDEHGRVMRDGLSRGGVDVDHLVERFGVPTAWARITYRGEDREFEFHVADSAAVTLTSADLRDLPERADWVHLSGTALVFGGALVEAALEAAGRAVAAGARLSVDPNVRPESLAPSVHARLLEVIDLAHVLLPSEGELASLGVDPQRLVRRGAVVCTTLGDRGAVVLGPEGEEEVPAAPTEAVDTDGAGDTFAAGFIAAAMRGAVPLEAARSGVRSAARAVAVAGPMTATFDGLA